MTKDTSVIPKGWYCYKRSLSGEFTPCPYWSRVKDKHPQECGYCSFLEEGDWEIDGGGLLWDRVKECQENDHTDEELELWGIKDV